MNKAEMYKSVSLQLPNGDSAAKQQVLLHSCCAPCSAAIVECMLRNEMKPTVYFSNSNIYPQTEYETRKTEIIRFLTAQNVPFVEDEYDYAAWLKAIQGLENEPERGRRCSSCFRFRLTRAAAYAEIHGFTLLTTTLASSRWKNIEQINEAGRLAVQAYPHVEFWEQNWRKGGLQERRNELLHLNEFYNQQYCGCQYSMLRLKPEEREVQRENRGEQLV